MSEYKMAARNGKQEPAVSISDPASTEAVPGLDHEVSGPITDNTTPAMSEADLAKARGKAYSDASTALREKYRDEFNADIKARLAALGIDWSPRPTKKERTREQILKAMKEAGITHAELAGLTGNAGA